ncbi:MAG TPA: carboxymuconolactone decarboxylase family protein [Candidatus Dormibacteraeota bacterium]|nr:carboxymuconolactone decarboxylase family protein [Candidatus Dormibacteraeota bacterium]
MRPDASPRIEFRKVAPQAFEAVRGLEKYIHSAGLEERLVELVKLRASQLNGCAFCVDMHARRLRELGEPNERIDAVAAWSEGPFFDERERAALEWTESVTLLSRDHVPDPVFERVRGRFGEAELVHLTMVIATINVWNRLAVPFRTVPEGYRRVRGEAE